MKQIIPPIRYTGSKYKIAPWVISHFPRHKIFVDVFGGAGAITLAKEPSQIEIFNDLDSSIVNLFRVIRDPEKCEQLIELVALTPYSREEKVNAFHMLENVADLSDVEYAYYYLYCGLLSFRGFQPDRNRVNEISFDVVRTRMSAVTRFNRLPQTLKDIALRFKGIQIEHRDYTFMSHYAKKDALLYCDPPYPGDVLFEKKRKYYTHDDIDYENFLQWAKSLDCMCIISGYESELYQDLLKDWLVAKKETKCRAHAARTECLWLNPLTVEAQNRNGLLTTVGN